MHTDRIQFLSVFICVNQWFQLFLRALRVSVVNIHFDVAKICSAFLTISRSITILPA